MIIKFTKVKSRLGSTKVYARVASSTVEGKNYLVGYIRNKVFRGWICQCESFLFIHRAKNRNCKHIKEVRAKYGRYGTKVPLTGN